LAASTTLLCLDIFAFGLCFLRYFDWPGKLIAAAIPWIMVSGWLLAAELFDPAVAWSLAPVVSAVIVLIAIFFAYGLSPPGQNEAGSSTQGEPITAAMTCR
jgi:hypothetical protein